MAYVSAKCDLRLGSHKMAMMNEHMNHEPQNKMISETTTIALCAMKKPDVEFHNVLQPLEMKTSNQRWRHIDPKSTLRSMPTKVAVFSKPIYTVRLGSEVNESALYFSRHLADAGAGPNLFHKLK